MAEFQISKTTNKSSLLSQFLTTQKYVRCFTRYFPLNSVFVVNFTLPMTKLSFNPPPCFLLLLTKREHQLRNQQKTERRK